METSLANKRHGSMKVADRDSLFWKERSEKWVECRLADPQRNKEFYEALFDRLKQHNGDAKRPSQTASPSPCVGSTHRKRQSCAPSR